MQQASSTVEGNLFNLFNFIKSNLSSTPTSQHLDFLNAASMCGSDFLQILCSCCLKFIITKVTSL